MALKDGDIITLDYEGRTEGVLFDTKLEKVSKKDFANNHPAGNLVKKLTLQAQDLMIPASSIKFLKPEEGLMQII